MTPGKRVAQIGQKRECRPTCKVLQEEVGRRQAEFMLGKGNWLHMYDQQC